MIKKIKYNLENFYYQKKYKKRIDIDDFKLQDNKFTGKKLNILYLSYFDGPYTYNNVVKVIEEFGNVFRFEMTTNPHEKDWYLKKEVINQKMLNYIRNTISKNNIDVILCYLSGHSTSPKVLEEIKKYNIPMINESLDDERKFKSRKGKDGIYRGNKDICSYFDLTLTTSKSAILKYLVEGGNPIYKDYCGNEKIYKKLEVDKEYDVSFIGASYGVRGKYIKYLQDYGISVYTKGNGWDNGFATDEEMIEIFNKSKIVLGFSTVGKNDDINILKGRDFEVPLTSSFYITGYHEELKEYFNLGKDIETYSSKEDLLEKVKYYLKHEKEREFIASTGYLKCIKNYTAKESYKKTFAYLGL
jgi:spore maturation protein CgeB